MDRLATVALPGALLGAQNQVVILEEAPDSGVAIEDEATWGVGEVGRKPREVLAHGGQCTRWRGPLRLAIEVLVQGRRSVRDPVQIRRLRGLQVGRPHVCQGGRAVKEIDHLVSNLTAAAGVAQKEGVDRRWLPRAVSIEADPMGLDLAQFRLALAKAEAVEAGQPGALQDEQP